MDKKTKKWVEYGLYGDLERNKTGNFIRMLYDCITDAEKDNFKMTAFCNIAKKYDLEKYSLKRSDVRMFLIENILPVISDVKNDFIEEASKLLDQNFKDCLRDNFIDENVSIFSKKTSIKELFLNICKENDVDVVNGGNWEEYFELLSYQIRMKKIRLNGIQKRTYYVVYR